MRRWKIVLISMITVGIIWGSFHGQIYAGELGGFDVGIGAEEDVFDDWEEEPKVPEMAQEAAKPEKNTNVGSCESSQEANNSSGGSDSEENNSSGSNSEANNNIGGGSSFKEDTGSSGGSPEGMGSGDEGGSDNNSHTEKHGQNAGSSEGYYATSKSTENTDPQEGQPEVNTERKSKEQPKKKTKEASKEGSKEKSPTETPSMHKATALGTVSSAIGMAKISWELKFYNSDNENEEKVKNMDGNYNKTVYFHHAKTVPANEFPQIKLVRTEENQDITILSLRLNGKETFWHQEGDTIILDEPVTKKTNLVELLAVLDGKWIVKMPVWTIE